MPTFAEAQLDQIDERAAAARGPQPKMGTVAWRGTISAVDPDHVGVDAAGVVFDGSSGSAQPVKCFETVIVDVGDRVGCIRYESEWIVTGSYNLRTLADAAGRIIPSGNVNTSSTTFVDMPSSPSAIIPLKFRDATALRIEVATSMYTNVAATTGEIGANIASTDGSVSFDLALFPARMDVINAHLSYSGGSTTTATLPAGVGYAVTARYRVSSGTGQLQQNGFDIIWITAREVVA